MTSDLDPEQKKAVMTTEGPLLIIAGAGSGKTRVITYRIARLLDDGVPQESILALTFTNKAAREMADRARSLVGLPLKNLMVSTFHSFGAWLLRKEIHRLGWKSNFTIYDEQDRVHAVKESARDLGMVMANLDAAKIADSFSSIRSNYIPGSGPGAGKDDGDDSYGALYAEYRKTLRIYNAVDFDDLIAMPLEIMLRFPEVAEALRGRFRYVMIDEFQDTSLQQYELVRTFAPRNICAVGDDDQSIYSWRGANFGNIEKFEKDFPGLVEIKLERNYRSTSMILDAANALIAHNVRRKKKNLWSPEGRKGIPILVAECEDEVDEAKSIIERMRQLRISDGLPWDSFGILVRTNYQSRQIEEELMESGVPYRTAGGPSFYQRREVKDMLAYLRLCANPDDDVSALRVMNVPRRGIGKAGIEKITGFSRSRNISIHTAASLIAKTGDFAVQGKPVTAICEFFDYIETLRDTILSRRKSLSACLRDMVAEIGYWQYLLEEYKSQEKAPAWKYHSIELLASSIERWERDPDTMDSSLFAYLGRVALLTRDESEDDEGKVSLLTIHSAKGLEFDIVFVPGCEDGIMPHAKSLGANGDVGEEDGGKRGEDQSRKAVNSKAVNSEAGGSVEEERRLFYVALTRAKKRLFLSRCLHRRKRGQQYEPGPSPFLAELPADTVSNVSEGTKVAQRSEEDLQREMWARLKAKFR
ncbi:MAG: UvrD-helicase domain-containing protein [Spirochaetaceae bacterium]|nr:UvrD-helicase domain-containing protein [Spirochaetaceae bacterium]